MNPSVIERRYNSVRNNKWDPERVNATQRFLESWCSDPFVQNQFHSEPKALLDRFIDNPSPELGSEVPLCIQRLLIWKERHGAMLIMQGKKKEGWETIASSWDLIELFGKVEHQEVKKKGFHASLGIQETGNPDDRGILWGKSVSYTALLLHARMATGNFEALSSTLEHAVYLANRMTGNYYIRFAICLAWKALGIEKAASANWYKVNIPGNEIITHWEDPKALEEPMFILLQERVIDESSYSLVPFKNEPWWICPIEILSLVSVREKLGLKINAPDHPLMKTPLAEIPTGIEAEDKDWIASLEEAIFAAVSRKTKKTTRKGK